ncbi:hypothetical protein D3P08_14505 [Paenibacillus nanensis]|uniref:Nitroreductase domain-containing protein n=1 Tax=Paenibacillus nanensis TaxID=393251 RepID=A0A3A1UUJ7_9BACL|nr:hypothetical protein [Paenibacillus nanensis]RIX52177.1 hypothetical protein D3P08_14505 [Paenibacillus nanensis]
MSTAFLEAVKEKRANYGLSKERFESSECIEHIVRYAVKHTPSAFNSQRARIVVLFGRQSEK